MFFKSLPRPTWGVGGPGLGLEIMGSWLMWKALQKEPKTNRKEKKRKKAEKKKQKKLID